MTGVQAPIPPLPHSMDNWRAIRIVECGEKLISLRGVSLGGRIVVLPQYHMRGVDGALSECFVRESVAERLVRASGLLPNGLRLAVWDAWRPRRVQKALFEQYLASLRREHPGMSAEDLESKASEFVSKPSDDPACPAPHITGGAVDLSIVKANGEYLEMGTEFDDFSTKAHTRYFEHVRNEEYSSSEALHYQKNRRLLYHVMTEAGFTNYPYEWWHYDYGNQWWAALTGRQTARYGVCVIDGCGVDPDDLAELGEMKLVSPQSRLPVVLVQATSESELAERLKTNRDIELVDVFGPDQYSQIPRPSHSVPELLLVINAKGMQREVAVTVGLLMRNAGHQVFITTHDDYEDLLELMGDVHRYTSNLEDKDVPFRTELLVTEHAIEVLGDVSSIIDRFEREFLVEDEE